MLQIIFGGMLGGGVLFSLLTGQGAAVFPALLGAAQEGVETAISLAGCFALFCGLIGILRAAGAVGALSRLTAPLLRRLMGEIPADALDYVTMNLAANMLGLGNAATPMGVEAARRMAAGERASDALCFFLVLNASSVQLLPTTVIALRAAAGSQAPGQIALPALVSTLISTLAGALSCKLAERLS